MVLDPILKGNASNREIYISKRTGYLVPLPAGPFDGLTHLRLLYHIFLNLGSAKYRTKAVLLSVGVLEEEIEWRK